MARGRAKLTEKQERILIQAQLMGLTPRDMQQISNRLIALQKESKERVAVNEAIQGYSWSKDAKKQWSVTTPDGYVCEFTKGTKHRTGYWDRSWDYNVKVTKPGTAFKTRYLQKKQISVRDEWVAKLCPENSKELYGIIRWAHNLKREIKE